jgi:hypothetical protein
MNALLILVEELERASSLKTCDCCQVFLKQSSAVLRRMTVFVLKDI